MGRPRISTKARRARLVARHHLGRTARDPLQAVAGVVAMHSSDPVTPHLAMWARVVDFEVADLEECLYDARQLWRMHAMRRTLFVVPTDGAEMFVAGACAGHASRERRRVEGWLEQEVSASQVSAWLADVEADTLRAVAAHDGELSTSEVSQLVPRLQTEITIGSGKWATRSPLSSRLLVLLALEGKLVRAAPAGTWRSSQYRWATTEQWFDRVPEPPEPAAGRAALARRYLDRFGPATADDLHWWSGWSKRQTAAALDAVDAVTVDLDGDREGFVLPGDVDTGERDSRSQVALLPGLDPTPMGWKHRDWFLGDHDTVLFDRNGNVGPTVWVNGRVVGGWHQRTDGAVTWRLLEDVAAATTEQIAREAAALQAWLAPEVVATRFPSRLQRELSDH